MIDPKKIRQETELVKKALESRHHSVDVLDRFLAQDVEWRKQRAEVDAMINERKSLTPKGKPSPEQLAQLKQLSEAIKTKQEGLQQLELDVKEAALHIPNVPDADVPVGKDEDDNTLIKEVGALPTYDFDVKSHDDIGLERDILNFDHGAKLAGSRFVVYKGAGAKLERALSQFMLDVHTEDHGYTEYLPPVVVNSDSLRGTGQLPKFADDCFSLEDTDYWLSPTAEVQLTNLYRDTIVEESELPLQLTAHTSCFRKEAGSYGKDVKGIIRQHQFNKVELVHLVHPEDSEAALERLLSHAEKILQLLELPYRVVKLCTGDLGFSASKTYDLEVWFPSQNTYREISSCSRFLDFQARRAMIRYRASESGEVSYLHTLNGSGLAVGRTVAAILENFQTSEGRVIIPKVLQKYMNMEML
jgi:seryl-tRNA synthetase